MNYRRIAIFWCPCDATHPEVALVVLGDLADWLVGGSLEEEVVGWHGMGGVLAAQDAGGQDEDDRQRALQQHHCHMSIPSRIQAWISLITIRVKILTIALHFTKRMLI